MFLTLIVFIIVLSVLVFVHELGHFYTAKKLGVPPKEFGFGFPPRMCGWKKVNGKRKFFWGNQDVEKIESEDTVYSLNWLPLGGFVNLGEDDDKSEDPNAFINKSIWKRATILTAGVTMNVILAIFCLIIALMIGAPHVLDENISKKAIVESEQI